MIKWLLLENKNKNKINIFDWKISLETQNTIPINNIQHYGDSFNLLASAQNISGILELQKCVLWSVSNKLWSN